MTEMFGEAWSPMSVPDLAPDDDDDWNRIRSFVDIFLKHVGKTKYAVLYYYRYLIIV